MQSTLAELEQELLEMSARDAPGREFCDAIAELARTGRFAQLRSVLPGVVFNELHGRYKADPMGLSPAGGRWHRTCARDSSSMRDSVSLL